MCWPPAEYFFLFADTATTEIYTLSLHDALPIYRRLPTGTKGIYLGGGYPELYASELSRNRSMRVALKDFIDRKSTRLNSSHQIISYAVLCLKKKNVRPALLDQRPAQDEHLTGTR